MSASPASAMPIVATPLVPAARIGASSTIVFLALLLWLLVTAPSLLGDPDSQWHVAVGRWIATARTVPTTDLFSHTFAGAPWIAKEWLSQLVLFAAYQAAGWWGVVVLAATAIAGSFAILHAWLSRRLQPTAALAATLVAIVLAQPHFLARPHMLVLPIIIVWMASLVTALERGRAPPPALALLMALWANMHGSFPLGLVMAAVLAGEGVLLAPRAERWRRLRGWGLFLALALAVTALSPYGWRAMLVSLHMSGNAETLAFVDEWHPLRLDGIGLIALAVLASVVVLLVRDLPRTVFRLLAVGLIAYLMLRHARFISLFAVVAPVLAAGAAARWTAHPAPAGASAHPRLRRGAVMALALAVGLALALVRPAPAADVTPDAAFRFATAYGVAGPVYNDYDFGGYLIAHGVRTFVDGRTDQLFLGDFLPRLAGAIMSDSDAGLARLVARYHVTWALVRAGSRDAGHFTTMPGWRRIYADKVAAVFVAP